MLSKKGNTLYDEKNNKLTPTGEGEIIIGDLDAKECKKFFKENSNKNKNYYHDVNVNRIFRLIIEIRNYIGEYL